MPRRNAQVAGDGPETRARKRARLEAESGCCWPTAVEALANRNLLALVLSYHKETYEAEWDRIREDLILGDMRRVVARQPQFEFHHNRDRLGSIPYLFLRVCRSQKLEAAQWFHTTFQVTAEEVRYKNNAIFAYTCEQGDLAFAQWLHATFAITVVDARSRGDAAFRWACFGGHLAVAQWLNVTFQLIATNDRDMLYGAFEYACARGQLPTVRWLHGMVVITGAEVRQRENQVFRWACSGGHLDVAQWLHTTFQLTARDITANYVLQVERASRIVDFLSIAPIARWLRATFYPLTRRCKFAN